jgi:SPOR domain
MADDNTSRAYRSNEPYRRSAKPSEEQDPALGGSDPLAELARLIGQDPYAESARRQPQRGTPQATQHGYDDEAPGDWRRHIQRPNYGVREEPAFDLDQHYATDPHAVHDPYRMATPQPEESYADPNDDHRREAAYAAAPDDPDEPIYAAQHHGGYAADQYHGGGMDAHDDDGYDDPPRRNRGSSLVTAVVLIGCAMLGTAGAYGYRTYSSGPSSTTAPVIIADSSPNKIVPAEPKSRSQDRVGEQGSDERLVSREEQPVALQSPATTAVPRVVFPSPVQTGPTTTGTTNPPSASFDQPKPIRTVPIRPESSDSSGRPFGEEPSRTAPAARTAPNTRTASTPTASPPPPAQRAPSRDQPLSLDPAGAPRETAAPAPRVAAVPPNGGNPGTAGNSGGFIVQVSSQRSEADAQASYRALQAKYSQLKSHQPIIRRADLGAKGVYYRAMVGPFESGDEAVQFCNGLKQAGGQCIIHRN